MVKKRRKGKENSKKTMRQRIIFIKNMEKGKKIGANSLSVYK